ncbi:Capsular polysaccharide biosynthesis protein [Clostridium cavendishii DSM 21758]|uniref:Capsular polysaccharide biosynthesis protein n=1 Tax=Clostridium cavendishii DSM 21758 TaxID=1121302 RepID=A0A1M6KRE5_9CLOT|nr:Wzz/FepE/Etk N-terminal domain-containing protein [Clostridium cavendishii]SHJ61529.1 Capsular polysaccharide biosynthesis protein [Clostridium cavendishii DSM 21758]
MEIKEYFKILNKRKLMVIAITLSCALLSAVVSYFVIKPVYKSEIKVAIDANTASDKTEKKQDYQDVIMYQKLVKSYSKYATSRVVIKDVIKELNLSLTEDELINMISVAPEGDTEFLAISVKSKDKYEVSKITDQLALSLKNVTKKIKNADNVQLIDAATVPAKPDSPKPALNIAIAFVIGLMLSVGLVFLLEYLDNTVKDEEELKKILGCSVLGVIPVFEEK